MLSLLHIANSPGGRRYLHSGPMGGSIDFRRLLSPLVDPDYPSPSTRGKQNPKKQETGREPGVRRQAGKNKLAGSGGGKNRLSDRELRWQAASDAVLLMMRTWQGVILLTSDRQGGLRALFSMLVQPVPLKLRKVILHLVYQIVCIGAPNRLSSDLIGLHHILSVRENSNVERSASSSSDASPSTAPPASPPSKTGGEKRRQLFRQASKNWNIVRTGLGLGPQKTSSPNRKASRGGESNNQRYRSTKHQEPLKHFQEQYISQIRLK